MHRFVDADWQWVRHCNGCDTAMEIGQDSEPKPDDVYLDDSRKTNHQAAIGSLIYFMLDSRPDLAFSGE